MKIALIGYGKMGKTIEGLALAQGHSIAGTFDIDRPADVASLHDADVCIEFSTPKTAVENIRTAIAAKKDIVVGTTGWYEHLPEIRQASGSAQSGLVY